MDVSIRLVGTGLFLLFFFSKFYSFLFYYLSFWEKLTQ